jgi:L-rhamnose mutarotase
MGSGILFMEICQVDQESLKNKYAMNRSAFKMKLKAGCEAEYQKRHDEIWPDLAELIKQSGVYDYSIFLDRETNILFAVQKQSGEQGSQDLGNNPLVRKWWDYMSDIMEVNADNSPVTIPLNEVFYLE